MIVTDEKVRPHRIPVPAGIKADSLQELRLDDFTLLFGTTVQGIPQECRRLIEEKDFRYMRIEGADRERVLLEVLKKIDSDQFSVAGKEAKGRWEKGWAENLDNFVGNLHDLSKLVPKYIREAQPLRFRQEYILPVDPNFELNWYEVFRQWLFRTYFRDAEAVYEFGCGSGFNLATLVGLYPDKRFFGLDWAAASTKIVNEMARTYGWKLEGIQFDFFAPDYAVKIAPGSIVLTVGALEQTGRDCEAFLQYLLKASPKLCVHIEPIVEWYDENNLIDYAAIRFHQKRKYWEGFPQRLGELQKEGSVEILKEKRSFFGSLYLEGYSQLMWRPQPS